MKQQYQQQYVTSLLGDNEPTDYHSKLWEWYEKEDKPNREKWLAQNAANEERRLEIQKNEGLVPLIDKLSKAGIAGLKLKQVLDKQAKKREIKEKEEFFKLLDKQDRSNFDHVESERKIFTHDKEYAKQGSSILKEEQKLIELTSTLPTDIQNTWLKMSPAKMKWMREWQGLKVLSTATPDQMRLDLVRDGRAAELETGDIGELYKGYLYDLLAPYEFSNGTLSNVLYKGIKRLVSTGIGGQRTVFRALENTNAEQALGEQLGLFSTQANNELPDGPLSALFTTEVQRRAGIVKKKRVNEYNLKHNTEFINYAEILAKDKDYFKDQFTPTQEVVENLEPLLAGLAYKGDLDLSELYSGELTLDAVEGQEPKTITIGKRFFSDDKIGMKVMRRLQKASDAGKDYRYNLHMNTAKARATSIYKNCITNPGSCTQDDMRLAALTYKETTGDHEFDIAKRLEKTNLTAQTQQSYDKEKKEDWQVHFDNGSLLSKGNIARAKNINNIKLGDDIRKYQNDLTAAMQRQSFGTYEDRTLANLKMIEGEGSTATLENLGTGDKRTYRLAIEMTNYEFRRFTDYYGRDPKNTDIADLVAIDMEKEKKSKGFGVTIDDDETSPLIGLWSNDNKGNFPRFYASLIGKTLPGFDVITAGAKLTKDRLVSVDRRVSDAQHSMRFLPPKEGETYVDQLIRQKGLLNLDETISTIGRLVPIQTGKVPDIQANFTPVPELVYLAASIDGADQISIALAQAENHLNSTNSTVQQVVKSYGLKEKVDILRKAYEANKVKNIAIGDLIDSTGDTYLSLAWKTDPKNMTYNQRLRGALIASNRDEVNRAASVPANIDFNPNNNLNTKPPEGIDINNLQPIGDKPTPTPTGRIASGSPYWSGPTPEVKQEQYKGVDIYGKEGQILGLTRDNDGMVRKEYWENKGEPQVIYGFPEGPEGRRKFKEEAPELAKEFNL